MPKLGGGIEGFNVDLATIIAERLGAEVETVIECMKIDGTMAELHEKWFGIPPAPGAAAITPLAGFGQPDFAGFTDEAHEPSC